MQNRLIRVRHDIRPVFRELARVILRIETASDIDLNEVEMLAHVGLPL
jgi:hypothetical protein